jgi:hypothetical protein
LHDVLQLAGGELSNSLRHSRSAHACAGPRIHNPQRDVEYDVHNRLRFKPASLSDELRPAIPFAIKESRAALAYNAFKHGRYTAEAVTGRREIAALLRTMRALAGSPTRLTAARAGARAEAKKLLKLSFNIRMIALQHGGRGEIRTHEGARPLPVFKTGALNRSATLPRLIILIFLPDHQVLGWH